jgi:hypothetical protein
MRYLRFLVPALVLLAACVPAGPDPAATENEIALRMTGNDGAATGQVWEFRITGDDAFTCQMTSRSPLTGQVPTAVTGRVPGLFGDLAAIAAEVPTRPEISIFAGGGTITIDGETTTIPETVFSDAVTGGRLSSAIYFGTAPFGTCFLWG